jgi:hypothetical protein
MATLTKRATATCLTVSFCLSALSTDTPKISSSSPDLQKIFDNPVLENGVWTIRIPDGKYTIDKEAKGAPIHLAGQKNIQIIGSKNVELVSGNWRQDFIVIRDCKNITIGGFCVDLDPLPFLQGDITSLDMEKKTLGVKIGPEYVTPEHPLFEKFKGNVSIFPQGDSFSYIANPHRPRYEGATKLENGLWEISLSHVEERMRHGRLLMYAWFNGWLSTLSGSENIVLSDIRTYCVTGGNFYMVHNTGNITVRNCVIKPRDGSNRLWAADGGNQGSYNSGTITFENNEFSQINDDGLNMGTSFVTVMEKIDDKTLKLDIDNTGCFRAGDDVEIWDWQKKVTTAITKIVGSERTADRKISVRLENSVGDIVPGFRDNDRSRQLKNPYTRIINVSRTGRLVLRGNTISSFRARAALVKCNDSTIENNTFYNLSMESLLIGPEFYWEEGPGVKNLVIRKNTFKNVRTSAISIASRNADSPVINNFNILIENNVFCYSPDTFSLEGPKRNYEGNAIFIDNTDGAWIKNNTFEGFPDQGKAIRAGPAVKNIQQDGNRFRTTPATAK